VSTTDLFFADVSQFNGGVSLKGLHYVCARAGEGDWLADPDYEHYKADAHQRGTGFFAYWFLEAGSLATAQAQFAYSIAGKVPLMLDLEPIVGASSPALAAAGMGHYCGQAWKDVQILAGHGSHAAVPAAVVYVSKPGIDKALNFIDAYRKLGGICHDLYLPHWYWQVLGSPSLKPFRDRQMFLTSSDYTTYSDASSAPGWQPYTWGGGHWYPTVWQYSDNVSFNGQACDFNALRGDPAATTVAQVAGELHSLLLTGSRHPQTRLVLEHTVADGTLTMQHLLARNPRNTAAEVIRLTVEHTRIFRDGLGAWVTACLEGHANWLVPFPRGCELYYYKLVTG
jgi:Glycosyl hydrolases family 25